MYHSCKFVDYATGEIVYSEMDGNTPQKDINSLQEWKADEIQSLLI